MSRPITLKKPKPIILSKREKEVLLLITQGYYSNQIAEKLSISAKTMGTFKLRLRTKLGLHSKANDFIICMKALELEILAPAEIKIPHINITIFVKREKKN